MFVKEEKTLLLWLTQELEPLTMADPETLAEYVIALLKNDKDHDALVAFCVDQLMDFLKENTKSFVKDLFKALKDETYLNAQDDDDEENDNDEDKEADFKRGSRRGGDDDDDDEYGEHSRHQRNNRRRSFDDDEDGDGSNSSSNFRSKRQREEIPTAALSSSSARNSDYNKSRTTSTGGGVGSGNNNFNSNISSSDGGMKSTYNNNKNTNDATYKKDFRQDSRGGKDMHGDNSSSSSGSSSRRDSSSGRGGGGGGGDFKRGGSGRGSAMVIQQYNNIMNHPPMQHMGHMGGGGGDYDHMQQMGMCGYYPPYMGAMPPDMMGMGYGGPPGAMGGYYPPYGGGPHSSHGAGMSGGMSGMDPTMPAHHYPAMPPPYPVDMHMHANMPPPIMDDGMGMGGYSAADMAAHSLTGSSGGVSGVSGDGSGRPTPPAVPAGPPSVPVSRKPPTPSSAGSGTHASVTGSSGGPPPPGGTPSRLLTAPLPASPAATAAAWAGNSSAYGYYGSGRGAPAAAAGGSASDTGITGQAAAVVGGSTPSMYNYSSIYGSYGGTAISNAAVAPPTTTGATATAAGGLTGTYAYGNTPVPMTAMSMTGMDYSSNTHTNTSYTHTGGSGNYRNNKPHRGGPHTQAPGRGYGHSSGGSGGGSKQLNDLPESERCTLLCTGIPTYIKELDIMNHFRTFGRVVQLQVHSSDPTTAAAASTAVAAGADDTTAAASASSDKKSYNECLVQFSTSDEAKKCYSSPAAVLNNRFIRISQSNFNIIPPADVAPATEEELLLLHNIQNKSMTTSQQTGAGAGAGSKKVYIGGVLTTDSSGRPSTPAAAALVAGGGLLSTTRQPRPPRPALAKPAKNKKYIAGVTPATAVSAASPVTAGATTAGTATADGGTAVAAAAVTSEASVLNEPLQTPTTITTTVVVEGMAMTIDSNINDTLPFSSSSSSSSSVAATAAAAASMSTSSSSSSSSVAATSVAGAVAAVTPTTPIPTTTPSTTTSTSSGPTKQDVVLQQQYDDLRKLRNQVDSIWKTKQNLIQQQIDTCRSMITKIEKSSQQHALAGTDGVDKDRDTIETLEGKIVDLQSQLRSIQEQRVTGAVQQQPGPSATQLNAGRGQNPGFIRGGRGAGRFAGGGRMMTRGGRVSGYSGGRWRGSPVVSGRSGRGASGFYSPGGVTPASSSLSDTGGVASSEKSQKAQQETATSVLIPAAEWTKLPESFTANMQDHFGRHGDVRNMSSLGNGDLVIEYGSHQEADSAMGIGAVYEGQAMKMQWYTAPSARVSGGSGSGSGGYDEYHDPSMSMDM